MISSRPLFRKREIALVIIVLFGVLILALWNAMGRDIYHQVSSMREQLERMQTEQNKLAVILDEKKEIEKGWSAIQEEKDCLEISVPLQEDLPGVLSSFGEVVDRFPGTIQSLRMGEEAVHRHYGRIAISLGLTGHPTSVRSFLERIEDFPHLLLIESITWSYGGKDEVGVDLDLQLIFLDPDGIEPLYTLPVPANRY